MELKLGKSTREAYGETLVQLGRENEDIVVLDADLSKSTMTKFFAKEFPERFFNFGIAEANMVSVAAGLAAAGKIPFVSSFACFLVNKSYEQLKISVAGSGGFNIKFVASHGGISVGEDGFSQQSVEDIALVSSLPGFTVIIPADEVETREAVRAASKYYGPVYIRVGRPKAPIVYPNGCDFRIGKSNKLREGKDLTIIANGLLVAEALEAAHELEKERIEAAVIDMHTVKPLDEGAIKEAAKETGAILTVEEHLLHGGLGSRVAQVVVSTSPVPMELLGLKDTYGESGKPYELFEKFGISKEKIVKRAHRLLKRKKKFV